MDFKSKIDKVLKEKKIALWKLGTDVNMKSTIEKAYGANREMKPVTTDKFLQKVGINPEWWETGKGDVFAPKQNNNQEQASRPTSDSDRRIIAAMDKIINLHEATIIDLKQRLEKCEKERTKQFRTN